jgi:predicted permease
MAHVRFAIRTLGKTPVVTLVVVLSLGLGIGANTAIFSLLHQIILQSLPVENPGELVVVRSPAEFKGGRNSTDNSGGMESIFSYRVFRELEKRAGGVRAVAGFRNIGAVVSFQNQTENADGMIVSGGYFPVLGVKPLLGRLISPEDDVHGAGNAVTVLGYSYWQHKLGGRLDVLNQPVRVNGQIFTIVGVAPRGFTGTTLGSDPEVFVPMSFKPLLTPGWNGTDRYDDYWIYLFARLKPGVTMAQAEAALNSIYAGLVEDQAKTVRGRNDDYMKRFLASRLSLREGKQGQSSMRDQSRTPLYILMAATGLVLLIAMANAANLLLARSMRRRKELAIRVALGASRLDILSQLLAEAVLLSAAGGVAGLALASVTLRALLRQMAGDDAPVYFLTAQIQWPILAFALGLSLITGLLFGLHPAWDAARQTVATTLKDDSGSVSSSRGTSRVRKLLVAMQVAVSALLLVPTGLFLKSLVNLMHVDLGMTTESTITFRISPRLNSYTTERCRALYERAEAQLAAIPGVSSVAASMVPLIGGSNWGNSLTVEGYPTGPDSDSHSMLNYVGPDFFGKFGIPLIAGREFTERDTLAGPKVAIVNQQFARHFFGAGNPLGRKFIPGWGKVTPDIEIVGVVKDSNYSGVRQKVPRLYYTPWRQNNDIGQMAFYVRTALEPAAVVPQVRAVMASLDRDLPLGGLRTLDEQVRQSVRSDRLVLQLAAVFAFLATGMAMLGLYGVMAYSVTRRTREIGIRLALGAGTSRIRLMIARELMVILAAGLAVGVPAAIAVARLTESQLFGVKSGDVAVIGASALALAVAALLAGYIPARRATRVNPVDALRYE